MKNKKVLLCLLSLLLVSCSSNYEVFSIAPDAIIVDGGKDVVKPFSTNISLNVYNKKDYQKYESSFKEEIIDLHKSLDSHYSYEGHTNLYDLNESYGKDVTLTVDKNLYDALVDSINMMKLTDGLFNPTIGELISLWQPIIEEKTKIIPTEEEISKALVCRATVENIDDVIELKDGNSVTFHSVEGCSGKVSINLGAIGKGYALDVTSASIDTNFLIDGGRSSMITKGDNPNPKRDTWNIAILTPYKENLGVVALEGGITFSTSGDYEQYVVLDGVKYHHILNPNTGYNNNIFRSISLYSTKNAFVLDALTTALFNVNDIKEAKSIIEKVEKYYDMKIEALFEVESSDKKLTLYLSKGFDDSLIKESISDYVTDIFYLENIPGNYMYGHE